MDKIWFKKGSLAKRIWYKLFKSRSMHRTFLHNVWAMAYFILILGYFSNWNFLVIFATFVGYASHLLLDSFTISGIYWLWPYGDERIFKERKFYKNGKFVTGTTSEKIILSVLIIVGGGLIGFGLYRQNPIYTTDIYQTIISIILIIFIGIALMNRLVKGLSKATSRMFKQ